MTARPWVSVLLALLLLTGCAAVPNKTAPPLAPLPTERALGVVFCADGAGGLGGTTTVLKHVVAEQGVALRIEMVEWSHGNGRFLADHFHQRNIQQRGRELARLVQVRRARFSDKRICFVGQSAGCAVVLEAAGALPAGSVDRMVLLAPSVSSRYDLRPALRACREGIDVFYSQNDWFVLGLGMVFSGTTDRRLPPVAGRVGFQRIVANPGDEALYARLRQHPWGPGVAWTGHRGGHYGADEPGHVRAYVLPLLNPTGRPPPRAAPD